MAIHFGDNLDKSFAYTNDAISTFSRWFILILLSTLMMGGSVLVLAATVAILFASAVLLDPLFLEGLPMADANMLVGFATGSGLVFMLLGLLVILLTGFFLYGFTLRVYRGEELTFKNPGKMFVQGIVYFVIMFIYLIPATVISELVVLGPIHNMAYLLIVCLILPILLTLISSILAVNAIIRYAKEGSFGAAFQIGKLCSIISNIGWLRYFGHLILFGIIIFVVEMILLMIPFAGWILLIVATPFIMIFQAKFLTNLYESGEALEKSEEVAAVAEE